VSDAEKIAVHVKEIIALLEKNEPTDAFTKELITRANDLAPAAQSPTLEKWKRAAFKKLPKILMGL
jgi:hypothetical protein